MQSVVGNLTLFWFEGGAWLFHQEAAEPHTASSPKTLSTLMIAHQLLMA